MEKLSINHFKGQLSNSMVVPDNLFYMVENIISPGEVSVDVNSIEISDEIPEYEFIRFAGPTNVLPLVRKI